MSRLSERMVKKLRKLSEVVNAEKHLYFFGLVQTEAGPADRWDILVSARDFVPRSADAIQYIAKLLQKRLTADEIVQISRVVVLPRDNELIASLVQNGRAGTGTIRGLHPTDEPSEAVVIWPAKDSPRPMRVA